MERIVTAKLFKNGSSQAVRLPKAFRFEGDEVIIYREGKCVSDDFMNERQDATPQKRELF